MRESRDMSRKTGGVWGAKLRPCIKIIADEVRTLQGRAPQYPAREGIWTGKEPLLPRLAKHSDPIAKHIIKLSSYSRKNEEYGMKNYVIMLLLKNVQGDKR